MSWWSGFFEGGRMHAVEGQVFCPYRGVDTDIERCFACERFHRAGADDRGPWIRCRPSVSDTVTEASVFTTGR